MAAEDARQVCGMNPLLTIAARIPVTEAEGPGKRFAAWVQGCPMRCPGCCNPQYLAFESEGAERMTPDSMAEEILDHRGEIEGVTFIGGEPFSQAAGLAMVAETVHDAGLSVMVFSGFTLAALRDPAHLDFDDRARLLAATDLLVDGPYLQDQHITDRRWIGSANQRVHFLTDRYRHLEAAWDPAPNTIEIRLRGGELFVNGFPHPDFTRLGARQAKRSNRVESPVEEG